MSSLSLAILSDTCVHSLSSPIDLFLDSSNPESYCVYRPFCDNTTYDLDLFLDMPHKQFRAMALDDESCGLGAECCMV